MTQPPTPILPVTRADREAANKLFGGTPWSTDQFLSGKRDKTDEVQAFCAHRLRAVADADQMRGAVIKAHDALHQYCNDMRYPLDVDSRERRIAMAEKVIAGCCAALTGNTKP